MDGRDNFAKFEFYILHISLFQNTCIFKQKIYGIGDFSFQKFFTYAISYKLS